MYARDWLTSTSSVRFFTLLSLIVIIAGTFLFLLFGFRNSDIVTALAASPMFKAFAGLIGVVGAPAAVCLAIGMLWFWAKCDPSPKSHKALWLISFLIPFFGLAAYSLVVYRRQTTEQQHGE